MEWFFELLNNKTFVWCAMSVIIFALTQVLKLPIKHFTKNIENKRLKKLRCGNDRFKKSWDSFKLN